MDIVCNDVRREEDLDGWARMVRRSKRAGNLSLSLDFYYNFSRFSSKEDELAHAYSLVDKMLQSEVRLAKVTIGTDGLGSAYLPATFVLTFLDRLAQTNTHILHLNLDLAYLGMRAGLIECT